MMTTCSENSMIFAFNDKLSFDDFYGSLVPKIQRETTSLRIKRIIGTSLVRERDVIEDIDDMRGIRFCIVPCHHHSFQYGEDMNKYDLKSSFPNIDNDVLERIWHENITYSNAFEALLLLTKRFGGRVALENLANFKFDPRDFPSLQEVVSKEGWMLKEISSLHINNNEDEDNDDYDTDDDNSDSDYDMCSDHSDYDDVDNNNNSNTDNIEYKIIPLEGRKSYLDVLLTSKDDDDDTPAPTNTITETRHEWKPTIKVIPSSYKRKDRLYHEEAKLNRIDYDDEDDEGIMDIIYSEMSMKGLKVRSRIGSSILTPSQQLTKDLHINAKKG